MKQEKSEKKFYGQQCQDEELTMKFRDLHESLVNQVIAFCKENNIVIDEFHMAADDLSDSIKFGSWQSCTDSSLSFEKFTDEWKDIITMKNVVDDKTYRQVRSEQEPFLFSI